MRRRREAPSPAQLLPLLRELNDLKRVRASGRAGSIAERQFSDAWRRLAGGEATEPAMLAVVAGTLAAARLGDLDHESLGAVGLPPPQVQAIRARALDQLAMPLDADLRGRLAAGLTAAAAVGAAVDAAPAFVAQLAAQPRAGATCPGKPRLLLEPPENHAEHCLMVAVYGVLLAPHYGAEPVTVFLASLAHHLHNALLPDVGFTGEILLGDALEPAFASATALALDQLAPPLRAATLAARRILPDAETPEGRAFHAADTLDRVLQLEQHLRAGRTTLRFLLDDMALVHAGPTKPFQDALLAECDLT